MSRFVSVFFFSSRRRHTRYIGDWSSDVCSSDLTARRERGAYLCRQCCGAIHASSHRLHPSRGARRTKIRWRSVRRSSAGGSSRSGILPNARQGTGRNRRGPGGARERGVTGRPRYIATAPARPDLIGEMRRANRVAMDTEAASFHRYRDRIYLVQISSPTDTALIDPLAIAELAPVGALLADPHIEKV